MSSQQLVNVRNLNDLLRVYRSMPTESISLPQSPPTSPGSSSNVPVVQTNQYTYVFETTNEIPPGQFIGIGGEVRCDDPEALDTNSTKWWNPDEATIVIPGVACWTVAIAIQAEVVNKRNDRKLEYKFAYSTDNETLIWERNASGPQGNRVLDCSTIQLSQIDGQSFYLVHITLLALNS